MKKSTFSESQIVKEVESSRTVDEVARELGVAKATFYTGGASTPVWIPVPCNASKSWSRRTPRLKRMHADLALSNTPIAIGAQRHLGKQVLGPSAKRKLAHYL